MRPSPGFGSFGFGGFGGFTGLGTGMIVKSGGFGMPSGSGQGTPALLRFITFSLSRIYRPYRPGFAVSTWSLQAFQSCCHIA